MLLLIKQINFNWLANLNNKQIDAAIKGWANNQNFSKVIATILSKVEHVKWMTPLLANQIHKITDIFNLVLNNKKDSILISNK